MAWHDFIRSSKQQMQQAQDAAHLAEAVLANVATPFNAPMVEAILKNNRAAQQAVHALADSITLNWNSNGQTSAQKAEDERTNEILVRTAGGIGTLQQQQVRVFEEKALMEREAKALQFKREEDFYKVMMDNTSFLTPKEKKEIEEIKKRDKVDIVDFGPNGEIVTETPDADAGKTPGAPQPKVTSMTGPEMAHAMLIMKAVENFDKLTPEEKEKLMLAAIGKTKIENEADEQKFKDYIKEQALKVKGAQAAEEIRKAKPEEQSETIKKISAESKDFTAIINNGIEVTKQGKGADGVAENKVTITDEAKKALGDLVEKTTETLSKQSAKGSEKAEVAVEKKQPALSCVHVTGDEWQAIQLTPATGKVTKENYI